MAEIRELVFDCERPSRVARFWAAVLDGYRVRPYDDAELARLSALGASVKRETDAYTVLHDPEDNEFCVVAER